MSRRRADDQPPAIDPLDDRQRQRRADRIANERQRRERQRRHDRIPLRGEHQRHERAESVVSDRLEDVKDAEHDRARSVSPAETARRARALPTTTSRRDLGFARAPRDAGFLFHPLDDGFGFGDASDRLEPSRRLRQAASARTTRSRAPSDPATNNQRHPSMPSGVTRDENASEQSCGGNADEPEGVRPGGIAPAKTRGQQLAQVRVDERQLRTDADSGEKPRRDQHRRVHAERTEQA